MNFQFIYILQFTWFITVRFKTFHHVSSQFCSLLLYDHAQFSPLRTTEVVLGTCEQADLHFERFIFWATENFIVTTKWFWVQDKCFKSRAAHWIAGYTLAQMKQFRNVVSYIAILVLWKICCFLIPRVTIIVLQWERINHKTHSIPLCEFPWLHICLSSLEMSALNPSCKMYSYKYHGMHNP